MRDNKIETKKPPLGGSVAITLAKGSGDVYSMCCGHRVILTIFLFRVQGLTFGILMTSFSVFNWRILIFKSDLPANAKYIGSYLMTYMDEHGNNCYPSIKRISAETSLTQPTVCKYIQVLRSEGWLETKKKGFDGQAWSHNQYYPNIPDNVLKELYRLNGKGTKTDTKRHLNSHHKALKELNTISTVTTTDNKLINKQEERKPVDKSHVSEYLKAMREKLP